MLISFIHSFIHKLNCESHISYVAQMGAILLELLFVPDTSLIFDWGFNGTHLHKLFMCPFF